MRIKIFQNLTNDRKARTLFVSLVICLQRNMDLESYM